MVFHSEGSLTFGVGPDPDYVTGSIQRVDPGTGQVTTLYTECDGERLSAPNDIVVDRACGLSLAGFPPSPPPRSRSAPCSPRTP
jgi:sugar lactone lactonase YvrE